MPIFCTDSRCESSAESALGTSTRTARAAAVGWELFQARVIASATIAA